MTTDIRERITALERRLENRRTRLREDTEEAKAAARDTARRWLPVAAAAGAGLAALWMTRRLRGGAARLVPAPVHPPAAARRGLRWASLLGLAGSAYRFGTSPQVRSLLAAFRRRPGP